MSDDYRVRLDAFEGPLDLLLHLIRRAEVDIHDIPVAVIAEQYMVHLGEVHTIDIDLAGEFLVMAATLMEVKSRLLSPQSRAAAEGADAAPPDEDPRADLVRQLLEYKRHRDAADALDARRTTWQRRFPAGRAGFDKDALAEALAGHPDASGLLDDADVPAMEMDDLSLIDLVEAFSQIIAAVNFDRLGDHQVRYDDTPQELHQADILDRIAREGHDGTLPFARVFEGRTRGEMVGLFIAMLELVRQRRLHVRQETPRDPILLAVAPETEESLPDQAHASEAGPSGAIATTPPRPQ